MHKLAVYIVTDQAHKQFLVGVTSNLQQRIYLHKYVKTVQRKANRSHFDKLVYFEELKGIDTTLNRQLRLKRWQRPEKISLIESMNPNWKDLYHCLS